MFNIHVHVHMYMYTPLCMTIKPGQMQIGHVVMGFVACHMHVSWQLSSESCAKNMVTKSPAFNHFHDPEETEKPGIYKAQCKHLLWNS